MFAVCFSLFAVKSFPASEKVQKTETRKQTRLTVKQKIQDCSFKPETSQKTKKSSS